ncbi:MAG: hypothetical protein M3R16_01455 [Pseudomonadota bacterium]|nr:hypothetical protein [Pseudomonadota bacterium]
MRPLLERLMMALVMLALSFQGASGAMQRLMPAHYHAAPALNDGIRRVMLAKPDPHTLIPDEVTGVRFAHSRPRALEDHHEHEHEHDQVRPCDHDCERPFTPDHDTHPDSPALATGPANHGSVDDASHVVGHAHSTVLAHRHDIRGADVVLVAEEVDTPASALRPHGPEGLWSLLPDRRVFAVARAQGSLPAFESVTHRVLGNSAPRRPPRV